MWQRIFLLGLAILLPASLAVPADGSGCGQAPVTYSVQQVQSYVQPVQQYQALATYYVPQVIQTYSIGYTPQEETGSLSEELLRLKLEFKELQLQQLKLQLQAPPLQQTQQHYAPPPQQQFQEQYQQPQPLQQQYQQPHYPQQQQAPYHPQQQQMPYTEPQQQTLPQKTSMLQSRCGGCHESNRAKVSGGGFTLLKSGSTGHLTLQQRNLALREILAGTMPLGRPLTDAEKAQAAQEL